MGGEKGHEVLAVPLFVVVAGVRLASASTVNDLLQL